jgi:hypothetical protein
MAMATATSVPVPTHIAARKVAMAARCRCRELAVGEPYGRRGLERRIHVEDIPAKLRLRLAPDVNDS